MTSRSADEIEERLAALMPSMYAFALAVPDRGTTVRITALGDDAKLLDSPIAKVTLLGHRGGVRWKQKAGALEIVYPPDMRANTAVVFRVATSASTASP
jgi:alpha-L-fucosidase